MLTHAKYHAENPLPYFNIPFGLPFPPSFPLIVGEPATPRGAARAKRLAVLRIKKFQWMKGKGKLTANEIAIKVKSTTGVIHQQLERLVNSGHITKEKVYLRCTYEWVTK